MTDDEYEVVYKPIIDHKNECPEAHNFIVTGSTCRAAGWPLTIECAICKKEFHIVDDEARSTYTNEYGVTES